MKVLDTIAHIMKKEGVEYLSAYPTTALIESAAEVGIRPIICRQERVGVGIADGYARVNNGTPPGVFAMQNGPGAENAFAGVSPPPTQTRCRCYYSHWVIPRARDGVFPLFSSVRSFSDITKSVEQLSTASQVGETMRRAFARLKMGRPGPVMVEIPTDIADTEIDASILESYKPVKATLSKADFSRCSFCGPRAARRKSPHHPCRAGCAIRGRHRRIGRTSRTATGARHDHAGGKKCLP